MTPSFALKIRRLTLALLCCLPLTSQAASSNEAPLDLSIMSQRDALRPYMTAAQRITYIEAAQLIKDGQSDIRSGQTLQQQKPSSLDPNKDLRPIHERGKRTVEEGEAKIHQGQKLIVELLTTIQNGLNAAQAALSLKYNFELIEQDYASALEDAATQTLEACRTAGYKTVFFDGLRVITADNNTKAESEAHNTVYDAFIKADGKQFTLSVPDGLKLDKTETSDAYTFQYNNSSVFKGEQIALLAIELISPNGGVDALLSVRAFDLNSLQLISSLVYYIPDASQALASESESESEQIAKAPATPRTIPLAVTIDGANQLIDKLAGLADPYSFEIVTTTDNPAQSVLIDSLFKDTLLKNSQLIVIEGDFIQRTYLPAETEPEALNNAATAALFVTSDANNSYNIEAKAYANDRTQIAGSITLEYPGAE